MTKYSGTTISNNRLNQLINEYNIPINQIVNSPRFKWTKDNNNNIKTKAEIPEFLKTATLNEIFATCPFS